MIKGSRMIRNTGWMFLLAGILAGGHLTAPAQVLAKDETVHTTEPLALHDDPGGRVSANLDQGVTVKKIRTQADWSQISLAAWVHVSAFKLIPASNGEKTHVAAGIAMKEGSPDGPAIGKVLRGSTPPMADRTADYVKLDFTVWVKSTGLKSGKAPAKPARAAPTPPPAPPAPTGPPAPPTGSAPPVSQVPASPTPAGPTMIQVTTPAARPSPPTEAPPTTPARPPETSEDRTYKKSWAVYIGIENYEHRPASAGAVKNAETVKTALEKNGFHTAEFLSNRNATKSAIESSLGDRLPGSVGADDRLVIYFSGLAHTQTLSGKKKKGFLLPADVPAGNALSSAISIARVKELAEWIGAKSTLVIVDACVSDPLLSSESAEPDLIDRAARQGGIVMAATCGSDAKSAPGGLAARLLPASDPLGIKPPEAAPAKPDAPAEQKPPAPAVTPKDLKTDRESSGGIDLDLIFVPGGWFDMGPDLKAYVDGFWMGKYEITVGQWKKFLAESGLAFDWANNSFGAYPVTDFSPDDNCPMVSVSWQQAVTFVQWLSGASGKTYRLPTDAEWEYAARGGRQFEYATSNGELGKNQAACKSCGSIWDDKRAAPVGSFPPNPFGIHDLSGNAWEWCQDWHAALPTGKIKNPTGPAEGERKVSRGGSWGNDPSLLKTSHRGAVRPGYRGHFVGFRVVRVP